MPFVDISDLDLYEVLINLCQQSSVSTLFIRSGLLTPTPTRSDIDRALNNPDQYIDYLGGVAIKAYFSDLTKVETRFYNREYGEGQFERIVASLRK